MKNHLRYLTATLVVASAWPLVAAEDKPAAKEEKKELRVLSAPDGQRRVYVQQRDGEKREKVENETVTFLGVEASIVPGALSAQLALPRGTGLIVGHVSPNSAAAGALQEHDILLKLDDQILIEPRQLSVLVRNHREGDEVTLSYIRAGQKAAAKVKLGTKEVPKVSGLLGAGAQAFAFGPGAGVNFEFLAPAPGFDGDREDVDRVLSLIRRAPGAPDAPPGAIPPAMRFQLDRPAGPGFRAMAVHTGNSNLVFSDDDGSLELTIKDGAKTLVAKKANGGQLFSGPVSTPEERAAMPEAVRARLEKLEGMHDITFRTDGDFKGAEMKVVRPRGIALPPAERIRLPAPLSLFY